MKYDAIVAGAGTAGCVFAGRLARDGFKVLVVDQSAADELGHDWWDTVPRAIFDEIGIDQPVEPEAREPFSFFMNIEGRTLPIASYMPPELVNIERRLFAARLVRWARDGGVEFRFDTSAVEPVFESGTCTGVVVRDGNGDTTCIPATITLDATGIAGVLRRRIAPELLERAGMQATVAPAHTLLTWREVLRDTSDGGLSVICMDRIDSIAWLSREPDGLVDVFAGVIGSGNDAAAVARAMVAREGSTGETVRPGRRWSIPLRRPFDGLVLPGFMLAGDSACMADPSNGSGVSHAVRAAVLAAEAAAAAIRTGNADMDALWSYPARFFPDRAELAFLDALRNFIFSAPRDAVLSFMAAGGIRGPAFWTMRREFTAARLAAKAPIFLRTKGGTGLLAPMASALHKGLHAEYEFRRYPEKFDGHAFAAWRKRLGPS